MLFRRAPPQPSMFFSRFGLPEKWKGGRIEKYVNYWKGVARDYKESTNDILVGSKNRPFKAMAYSSTLLTLYYLQKTRPNEQSFRDAYVLMHHDLTLLPESTKNKHTQKHKDRVTQCENEGTLRFQSLGIATLVWHADYDSKLGLFSAQCEYLQPTYKEILTERIVDFGINNRWTILEKMMKDFDVNVDEWDENDLPINPDQQLKPMW